jgi:hypothetical protein
MPSPTLKPLPLILRLLWVFFLKSPSLPLLFPAKNQVVTKSGNNESLIKRQSSIGVSTVSVVSTSFALDTRKGV